MKSNLYFIALLCLSFFACNQGNGASDNTSKDGDTGKKSFKVENTADFQRTDEAVTITRAKFVELVGDVPADKVVVLKSAEGKTIPSQSDDLDKDGKWDELFFVLDIAAKTTAEVAVEFVDAADVPKYVKCTNLRLAVRPKVKGDPFVEHTSMKRETSEDAANYSKNLQMEGPAWENDKVAFRNYFDERNGIDIFGKRVPYMVLDSCGTTSSYHELAVWGMDVLKVGNSLGAGAIALYKNEKLHRMGVGSEASYEAIVDGDLRSILQFKFNNWNVDGDVYNVVHEISIWKGTHYYQNKVTISGLKGGEKLVSGIVNKHSDSLIVTDLNENYISIATHDKQAYAGEYLGMGLSFNKKVFVSEHEAPKKGEGIIETYYALMNIEENSPVVFNFYTVWEHEDAKYANSDEMVALLKSDAQRMNSPLVISK